MSVDSLYKRIILYDSAGNEITLGNPLGVNLRGDDGTEIDWGGSNAGNALGVYILGNKSGGGMNIGRMETNPVSGEIGLNVNVMRYNSNPLFVEGQLSNNNAAVGSNNVGVLSAVANAAAPTQVEGRIVALRTTLSGDLAVTLDSETVALASGSTIQDIPATSGGLSKFHLVSAASTNANNIKASAGQVYGIVAFNLNASPRYLKFHNTSGSPTAGSGVTDTFMIPGNTAGAGFVVNFDKGVAFSSGIAITLVTGITDADSTGVAASEIVLQVYYK
jgi:hypothetical protein